MADGRVLWQAQLGASISGGIAVASDLVVVGVGTPPFAPFVHPGNTVIAFDLAPGAAASPRTSPVASPSALTAV